MADFLTQIASVFSLGEDATEAQVLAAAHSALASQVPEDHVTMAVAQRDELIRNSKVPVGHEVVAAGVISELTDRANKADRFEKDLGEVKFEQAFAATVDDGRATPHQKSYYYKLFEQDQELALDMLREALPQVVTHARGDSGRIIGDAPEGTDPESYDLNRKVEAFMREKGWGRDRYTEALDLVLEQEEAR